MIADEVSLTQVPSIMQAMGFYPSSQEKDDMINEVKYSRFIQAEGQEVTRINLPDLIKLFVNHRPVRDISKEDIELALSYAKKLESAGTKIGKDIGKIGENQQIQTSGLVSLLQQFGKLFVSMILSYNEN